MDKGHSPGFGCGLNGALWFGLSCCCSIFGLKPGLS